MVSEEGLTQQNITQLLTRYEIKNIWTSTKFPKESFAYTRDMKELLLKLDRHGLRCCSSVLSPQSSWSPLSYKKIPPENVDRICAININWNFIHPSAEREAPWKGAQAGYNLWHISSMKCQIWKQFFWLAFYFFKKLFLCFVSPSGIWRYRQRVETTKMNDICVHTCIASVFQRTPLACLTILTWA